MLTDEQRAILGWIVIDPDGWYSHAINKFGSERAAGMLADKLARWTPEYDAAADKRPRAVREAE